MRSLARSRALQARARPYRPHLPRRHSAPVWSPRVPHDRPRARYRQDATWPKARPRGIGHVGAVALGEDRRCLKTADRRLSAGNGAGAELAEGLEAFASSSRGKSETRKDACSSSSMAFSAALTSSVIVGLAWVRRSTGALQRDRIGLLLDALGAAGIAQSVG